MIVGTPLFASYTYFDANNDAEVTGGSSIQWLRDGATIPGATGRLYTLRLVDAGKTISAEVTPLAQTGSSPGLPVVSSSVTVAPVNPASVVLTVRAGLKQLKFNWAAVANAAFYRVLYNPDGVSGFVPLSTASDNLSATSYDWDIAVHRINWPKAQFLLEACDSSGCLPSANISALNIMLGTIGYFKEGNAGIGDLFGISVALSADGNTLAVGAWGEGSSSTGIDSTPNELATDAGAVYVFTRSTTAIWTQQAYVKASNTGTYDSFGDSLALSGDGNTLAVGAYGEGSAKTGAIPGAPVETDTPDSTLGTGSGAVYVFTRSGATWSQQAYVKASNTGAYDYFGGSVALSSDGLTLAVGADHEDSAKTGVIPGAPVETDTPDSALGTNFGAIYLFTRSGGAWSQQAYVKASNTGADDFFGDSVVLSGDGNTLAVGAYGEGSAKTGVIPGAPVETDTPNAALGFNFGAVYVFTRSGGTWSQQAYVKASNTGIYDYFGGSVALSADGLTLAVGASDEDSAKTGVIPGAPVETDTPDSALGVNSGAVYVFTRSGGAWSQQAYVKASNTGAGDSFGACIALSADGNTLAVGAVGEDSAATGVNNTVPGQGDNSALSAGAVYLY